MSYTRPTPLLDGPTWAGGSVYVRPLALLDEASFVEPAPPSAPGYARPNALLDVATWAGEGAYSRPNALLDVASFVPPAPPPASYARPNALLDLASWADDEPYTRPNALLDEVVIDFEGGGEPEPEPVTPALFYWSGDGAIPGLISALLEHESALGLGDENVTYVMDAETPDGTVRIPISSWQATLQTERANYVQCVVPGALGYSETINAATSFTIKRRTVLGEVAIEKEMASAPVQSLNFSRGPQRFTAVLSGYSPGFEEPEEAPTEATTLRHVRSISTTNGVYRVRCGIDWLLKPGMRAEYDGASFVVAFINFYVQGNDAYMDVGERV
jgi:hypothetical protein